MPPVTVGAVYAPPVLVARNVVGLTVHTATADAMNRLKDGYFRTVASRDVDPFASGQPRPAVGPSPVSGQAPSTTGSSPAAGNTAPSNGQTQDPASSEPDIDTTG